MEENDLRDLESLFTQVEDPRMERTELHRLRDIIILAICGVIGGAEGWVLIWRAFKTRCWLYCFIFPYVNCILNRIEYQYLVFECSLLVRNNC